MEKEILKVNDLLSGYESERFAEGGLIRLNTPHGNGDGTVSLRLEFGADEQGSDSISIATVVMHELAASADYTALTQNVFSQLVDPSDIIF